MLLGLLGLALGTRMDEFAQGQFVSLVGVSADRKVYVLWKGQRTEPDVVNLEWRHADGTLIGVRSLRAKSVRPIAVQGDLAVVTEHAGNSIIRHRPSGDDSPPENPPRGTGQFLCEAKNGEIELFVGPDRMVLRDAVHGDRRVPINRFDLTYNVALSADGQWLLVGSLTKTRVFKTSDLMVTASLPSPDGTDAIRAVRFSPDGKRILIATFGNVSIVDLASKKRILSGHEGWFYDWRDEEGLLVYGEPLKCVTVYDLRSNRVRARFPLVSNMIPDDAVLVGTRSLLVISLGENLEKHLVPE